MTTTTKRGPGRPRRTDTVRVAMQVPIQFRALIRRLREAHDIGTLDVILYHIMPALGEEVVPLEEVDAGEDAGQDDVVLDDIIAVTAEADEAEPIEDLFL